ncbi:DUF4123 domain-containing protein [Pseudomonas palleroniana]|uniref:DUF4123 domain-containing protein n=1 Tax=Pseudomonas palleroniana TaxID=191390 RepID=A0A1H5JN62_9PSED|nr:DUF4123 domain-containing protein [Pseudomonas palleroniana]KAB0564359.1 DUF4123 domain-containing protein [Pseudomonas palleroniana]PTC24987.1 DUF4123 domain-containing protein [Pseudomonas palleroniana]SEE53401.1 protein of unknown function [Pseudomonas palleroniana]
MNKLLTPNAWITQHPLQADERIFAILSGTSGARPFGHWQAMGGGMLPQSIWAGTAYAEWDEVMPHVGIVEPGSAFLDWVATIDATDWGWLAVSSSSLDIVIAHLQSLTKVYLPDGQVVFLRFWDGAQFLPVVQGLGDDAGRVLPAFQRYLINGRPLTVAPGAVTVAKTSPWWRVPAPLLAHVAEQSPQTLIDNLLQWLEEQRPDLYAGFTPTTLQHKVAYWARRPTINPAALADYLASELS